MAARRTTDFQTWLSRAYGAHDFRPFEGVIDHTFTPFVVDDVRPRSLEVLPYLPGDPAVSREVARSIPNTFPLQWEEIPIGPAPAVSAEPALAVLKEKADAAKALEVVAPVAVVAASVAMAVNPEPVTRRGLLGRIAALAGGALVP